MTDEEREDLNTFKHDLVKQARWWQWKAEALEKESEQLKSENAALRERLEKAVEFKAKVGDRLYMPWDWKGIYDIAQVTVSSVTKMLNGVSCYNTNLDSDDDDFLRKYNYGQFRDSDFGVNVFMSRKTAFAHLRAELKGEKE